MFMHEDIRRVSATKAALVDGPESTTTREGGGLNVLAAVVAAGKKRQKHVCTSMLNLQ
jgi:hypothetical protein